MGWGRSSEEDWIRRNSEPEQNMKNARRQKWWESCFFSFKSYCRGRLDGSSSWFRPHWLIPGPGDRNDPWSAAVIAGSMILQYVWITWPSASLERTAPFHRSVRPLKPVLYVPVIFGGTLLAARTDWTRGDLVNPSALLKITTYSTYHYCIHLASYWLSVTYLHY